MIQTASKGSLLTRLPPLKLLVIVVVISFGMWFAMLTLATSQPWLGLTLKGHPQGGVIVEQSHGPASHIPPGTVLSGIADSERELSLEPLDVVSEPDGAMGTYASYEQFLQRQQVLREIQGARQIHFTDAEGRQYTVEPDPGGRPWHDLPVDFWVQMVVGLVAFLVTASVFAVRPGNISAGFLLLSGIATLMFTSFAAVYSTRELALGAVLFRWLSDLNFLGGSLFAASFVALLLYYPKVIARPAIGIAVVLVYVIWFIAQQLGFFESMTFARRFLVVTGVCSTFGLAVLHWLRTAKDPVARAALQWFLLSWMTGTIGFTLFILLPQMFGVDTSSVQGYSFLLFLLVYGGLAFGILHYRLFDLGNWWRKIILWTLAVLVLVLLDLFFVMRLHLSTEISLSLALLICGLIWLPLRAAIWRFFYKGTDLRPQDLFVQIIAVAVQVDGSKARIEEWQNLLKQVFHPLNLDVAKEYEGQVKLADEGVTLYIPSLPGTPPVRLKYADDGGRLFSPRDASLATEIVTMLGHAIESRSAYDKGVARERLRIARDLHDNIGGQLLTALHQPDVKGKDNTIRNTMVELREIINNSMRTSDQVAAVWCAEMRHECFERLTYAGIDCEWSGSEDALQHLDKEMLHALRAFLREAISNVNRHAKAKQVTVRFTTNGRWLSIEVGDDGQGFDTESVRGGIGLGSMRDRINGVGGNFDIKPGNHNKGTRLIAELPLKRNNHVD